MNRQTSRKWLWIDPRSKMLILLICVVAATTAPNLTVLEKLPFPELFVGFIRRLRARYS